MSLQTAKPDILRPHSTVIVKAAKQTPQRGSSERASARLLAAYGRQKPILENAVGLLDDQPPLWSWRGHRPGATKGGGVANLLEAFVEVGGGVDHMQVVKSEATEDEYLEGVHSEEVRVPEQSEDVGGPSDQLLLQLEALLEDD